MKTLKFFLLSILLGFAFFSLTSCSKDDNLHPYSQIPENSSLYNKEYSVLTPKQIGEYHIIAVELYLENDNGSKKTVKEIENTVVNLLTSQYPDLMKDFAINDEYNFIKPEYDAYSINPNQLESIIKSVLANYPQKSKFHQPLQVI